MAGKVASIEKVYLSNEIVSARHILVPDCEEQDRNIGPRNFESKGLVPLGIETVVINRSRHKSLFVFFDTGHDHVHVPGLQQVEKERGSK